jgi:predicted site-specific integrase-resolvase
MKSLREAAAELGIPEKEIRAMVDLGKVRAVMRKGGLAFAPDEIAKIIRQRKTLPESAKK